MSEKPKAETPSSVAKGGLIPKPEVAQAIQAKPALELPSEEDGFVESFIPISRRSLVRELMQDDFLSQDEQRQFEKFATALDSAIINQYHGNLSELKVSCLSLGKHVSVLGI